MNLLIDSSKEKTKLPQVLRAALKLFVQRGIDGTTIKDIAREAKVAEGALYRHFKSKEDLAWHLFHTHLSAFTADLKTKLEPLPTAEAKVRRFIEASFAAYEEDPDLFTYLILREHSELDKYSPGAEHPGHLVRQIIEEGQRSGEIRAGHVYVLGGLFIGGVIRIATLKMYGNLEQNLTSYSADVATGVWKMLAAHEGSA